MFEELLIPLEDISIKKVILDDYTWKHPNNSFFIIKTGNQKWSFYLPHDFWDSQFSSSRAWSIDQPHVSLARQRYELERERNFTTLKEARKTLLDILKTFLSQTEYEFFSKDIVVNVNQYHEVLVPYHQACKNSSWLYLEGKAGDWKLYIDAQKNIDIHENFIEIFNQTYSSRPEAIKKLHSLIELNLDQLYFSASNFQLQREFLADLQNNQVTAPDDVWWMMFVKPEVDLSKIF